MTESNSLRNAWSSTTFAGPPQPPQGTPHASYSSLVPPLGVLCKAGLVCFALLCFVFLATVTKTTWGIGVTCPRITGHLLCLWEREGRFRDIFFPLIYQSIKKKKKKRREKKPGRVLYEIRFAAANKQLSFRDCQKLSSVPTAMRMPTNESKAFSN